MMAEEEEKKYGSVQEVKDKMKKEVADEELAEKLAGLSDIGGGALEQMLGGGGLDFAEMMGFVKQFFEDFEARQIEMNNMLVKLRQGQEVIIDNQGMILKEVLEIERILELKRN